LGIVFAEIAQLPAGPLIILVNGLIFLISAVLRK